MARIAGAKGLAGGFRIEPITDWPERLAVGETLYLDDEDEPREVVAVELGGRLPVVRLTGVETRAAAESLAGRYLEVEPRELPEGSYYWHQLEGLRVEDESGELLGTLVEVFRVGENEVYRVTGSGGETLIPALHDVVRQIDLVGRRMVVHYESEDV
ncbi:MAG TPA: ribosome maturation factor RimM [Candidatus Limnocylindria bacterium]|nr:ribosome maturation factor RimM [Candidatus Limnocylindria bacterium]